MSPAMKWFCTSAATCTASFLAYAVPTLQVIALVITIIAGIRSLRSPRK